MIESSGSNSKRLASRLGILPYGSLPEGVQNRVIFLLNHLHSLSRAQARQGCMRQFHITLREHITLEMLYAAKHALPQHVIGSHLNMKPSVTSKFIDKLERRFLVIRSTNPANRKEKLVSLTEDRGIAFAERMLSTADDEVFAALPRGALREFTRLAVLVITEMEKDIGLSPKLNAVCKCSMEVTNV